MSDLHWLIKFLEDRLDEDEQIARAATPGPWRHNPAKQWHRPEDLATKRHGEEFVASGLLEDPICVAATGPADGARSMADADHIALHDPARALADVKARRQLLAFLVVLAGEPDLGDAYLRLDRSHPEPLRLLAAPYRDHPDYRPDWAA